MVVFFLVLALGVEVGLVVVRARGGGGGYGCCGCGVEVVRGVSLLLGVLSRGWLLRWKKGAPCGGVRVSL